MKTNEVELKRPPVVLVESRLSNVMNPFSLKTALSGLLKRNLIEFFKLQFQITILVNF